MLMLNNLLHRKMTEHFVRNSVTIRKASCANRAWERSVGRSVNPETTYAASELRILAVDIGRYEAKAMGGSRECQRIVNRSRYCRSDGYPIIPTKAVPPGRCSQQKQQEEIYKADDGYNPDCAPSIFRSDDEEAVASWYCVSH